MGFINSEVKFQSFVINFLYMTEITFKNKNLFYSNQTIAWTIDLDIPAEIVADDVRFVKKKDFHVSLVCIGEIARKKELDFYDLERKLLTEFIDYTNSNEIEYLGIKKDYMFVEQGDLKTIIVMCEFSGLEKYFEIVNAKYSLNLEYPPLHITLYVLPEKWGIFISDSNDILNFTKSLNLKIL